ncbi:UDP-diphosphatase [Niastella yeongjuensis]|uniref:Undecaprenyl-diphosphatase n=1 Tax=Niastella yeongjuensis TaxID=354355 RepID=A0A1V9EY50_9BACT|nr:undecaprenyl-diphosphate phosphatase [Niastella yeongjuensis]OQP50976.1 UDP-diphosphatase [Niastella yeongjuensis]SEN08805.1 undecaprenyl-diphosphatase [Niastella yeongjuensis]
MSTLHAIIIAIIEGITEFLPISSTGHMAIASAIMGDHGPFVELFEIVIQFGAILSVVVLYWRKFFDFKKISFYIKLIIAIIPALVFGALFKKHIDAMLEKPMIIAVIMLLGGFVLLFVDKWFQKPTIDREDNITVKKGFIIGCYQVLSILFPGLSRSAATIIGGMQQKLSRRLAAEFSFFLAVPTMLAATVYSLYKMYKEQPEVLTHSGNMGTLLLGCVIAFIVAILAIKFFITYLQKHGFRLFGWYRIIVGLALIILFYTGVIGK